MFLSPAKMKDGRITRGLATRNRRADNGFVTNYLT